MQICNFANEVTLTSASDTKGTPGLKLPYLHLTGYEPKASDARCGKLFKIRIICGISFDKFASLFWSLEGYEDFVEPKRRCNFVNWESMVKSFTVIRHNDAIVRPHLQSKIQESFEDCG